MSASRAGTEPGGGIEGIYPVTDPLGALLVGVFKLHKAMEKILPLYQCVL